MKNVYLKSIIVYFLYTIILLNYTFANCDKPVTKLDKGQEAPCSGYIFSPDKELEVRTEVEENKLLKKEVELKDKKIERLEKLTFESDKIIELEQNKTELWKTKAEDTTKKLIEANNSNITKDVVLVLTGIGITAGSVLLGGVPAAAVALGAGAGLTIGVLIK